MPANSMTKMKPVTSSPQADFVRALTAVLPVTCAMILLSWSGVFSSAPVELGLEHYAEQHPVWCPLWLPMPLNTLVNFGYIVCGLYWCLFIGETSRSGIVKCSDAYLFFVFNIMGCVYGLVQLYRIVLQTRSSAIMDQWYTLPFFMLTVVWAQHLRGKGSQVKFYSYMLASIASCQLTLLTTIGFETALGCHILLAVGSGVLLFQHYSSDDAKRYFYLALINCTGFVVLKLLDHSLPEVHWIFSYVSGHFLSKICDVLQIHYVNRFFFAIVLSKNGDRAAHKD